MGGEAGTGSAFESSWAAPKRRSRLRARSVADADVGGRELRPRRRLVLLPDELGQLDAPAVLRRRAEHLVGQRGRRVRVVPDAQMVLAEYEPTPVILVPVEVVAAQPLHLRAGGRSPPGMPVE